MTSTVTTRMLQPQDHEAWMGLLNASPQGSIYSSPAYLEALSAAADASFRLLGVFRGDQLVGGVALFERASWAGTYVEPRLLLYYNGLVRREPLSKYSSDRTARDLEVDEGICTGLASTGYASVTLKNLASVTDVRMFLERGWIAKPSYTYVVPLDDLDAQRGRVEQNLRRLIKRCTDSGFTLSADDNFESFYSLHRGTADRKGAQLYLPHSAFGEFYRRLRAQGLAQLYQARLPDGRVAASQLVLLGPYPGSHTVAAGTDAEHLRSGVTAFLRWKVFEALAALGYKTNDLTDAGLNPVTHFKAQLGGRLEMCFVLTSPVTPRFRVKTAAARVRGALSAWLGRR